MTIFKRRIIRTKIKIIIPESLQTHQNVTIPNGREMCINEGNIGIESYLRLQIKFLSHPNKSLLRGDRSKITFKLLLIKIYHEGNCF